MNGDSYRTTPAFAIAPIHRSGPEQFTRAIMHELLPEIGPGGALAILHRPTAEKCLALVERVLAAQGEVPEPLLVKLQHALVRELQPERFESEPTPGDEPTNR